MQTYLQREELASRGLNHFDNWAATFGEVVSALELAPSGQGYRIRERFSKFVNLQELMNLFHKVADIKTADMLNLNVPEIAGGKPETIAVDPSPELTAYVNSLVKRAKDIAERKVKPEEDNMLCVTNDGRNAALDMRCIDPTMPDYPDSKVNTCINKVFEIYKATEANKLTQMIFCDLSTPKKVVPMKENENGEFEVDNDNYKFSVYNDVRAKLLTLGVKPSEFAFIHDANTDEQKEKMFAAVRRGEIRIIMGSTQKMGAGTNAQKRLIALHHLDCPWRPSDLEQREGRIVRQGNDNPVVQIYQYVCKQSFDAYLWQIIESKQKSISQIMSGKNPSREMDDIDETVLNYAEVKAIATGNPLIKRKMELDIELQRLQILEAQHRQERYHLEDQILKVYPANLAVTNESIKGLESDIALRNANGGEFQMTLGKKTYDERKTAGEMLLKIIASNQYADKVIGTYRGFAIIPQPILQIGEMPGIKLKGELAYKLQLSDSDVGSIARIENCLTGLEKQLEDCRKDYDRIQKRLEASKAQLNRPFEQESQLQATLAELATVNAVLDVDKTDEAATVLDEDSQEQDNDEDSELCDENDYEDEQEM